MLQCFKEAIHDFQYVSLFPVVSFWLSFYNFCNTQPGTKEFKHKIV